MYVRTSMSGTLRSAPLAANAMQETVLAVVCVTGYVRTLSTPAVLDGIFNLSADLRAPIGVNLANGNQTDTVKGQRFPVEDSSLSDAFRRLNEAWLHSWTVSSVGSWQDRKFECHNVADRHFVYSWLVDVRPDVIYAPIPPVWLKNLNETIEYHSDNSDAFIQFRPAISATNGVRYFKCACTVVRTPEAMGVIAAVGLGNTHRMGPSWSNVTYFGKQYLNGRRTSHRGHYYLPTMGKGICASDANRFLRDRDLLTAYQLLDRRPWAAG
jgi:hypothetical protein